MLCCSRPGLPGTGHRHRKQRVQLQLMELEGVTLSNGVLFAKVRLLSGGRFCAYSARKEIRDNKVAWTDQGPMEFTCRLGDSGPPIALRVSVRKEERGGRSYSKLGYAVLNLTELLSSGVSASPAVTAASAEHSCILSPYNQRQRLDNSTLRLGVRRLANQQASTAATSTTKTTSAALPRHTADTSAAASSAPPPESAETASASLNAVVCHLDHMTAPPIIIDSAGAVGSSAAHCRNPSSFSFGSLRTHSRANSLEQETMVPTNSSQSSSVPSFDLHLPSSLERKRAGLTATRELNSRIVSTRTDNFKIVREVLEQEGIHIVGPVIERGRLVTASFT